MSAGAYIAINGAKGKRFMTKNARLMLHTVAGAVGGQWNDVKIEIDEMNRLNDQIISLVASKSKLSKEEVKELIARDRYILPDEAIKLGLIDGVIDRIG